MHINIDLLHKVVEGKVHGRAVGHTFSQVQEIAGILEVREDIKTIVVILPWMQRVGYVVNMMKDIFDNHGIIMYNMRQDLIKINNDRKILFLSVHNARERLIGMNDCYIVYMDCTENDVLRGGMNVKKNYVRPIRVGRAHYHDSLFHPDSVWQ